jgi:hypothetical protein
MTSVAATNHTLARPRLTSGRIAYRDGGGAEIGRERFEIVSHHDGHVLRAFCEMDDIGLLRDVTIALDGVPSTASAGLLRAVTSRPRRGSV